VRSAKLIIEPPENQIGILHILELPIAGKIGAVEFYMRMDVGLVNMGRHHKLMLPAGKLHSQFIGDLIGFFRTDLPRLEGLDDAVHDNLPALGLTAPGELIIKSFADFKFFSGSFWGTHIGKKQFAVPGFLRLLVIVVPFLHRLLPGSVLHDLSREYVGDCHGFLLIIEFVQIWQR
jgi:hypothetical protein